MAVLPANLTLGGVDVAGTPVIAPPPGTRANLVDPQSSGWVLVVVGSILMGMMLVFAALRFHVKIFVVKKTSWDDYTCGIAIFLSICYYIICVYAVTAAKYGIHIWDLSLGDFLSKKVAIVNFLVMFFPNIVFLFGKLSFLLLYRQLFYPKIWLRRMAATGAVACVGFFLGISIVIVYYTVPAPSESWEANILNPRFADTLNTIFPAAIGNIVLDVYIFLLPAFGIATLSLSVRKKIGALIIFSTGLMACVASALNMYYKAELYNRPLDFMYDEVTISILTLAEMFVGISASCMPALKTLFHNHHHHHRGSTPPKTSQIRRTTRAESTSSANPSATTLQASEDSARREMCAELDDRRM